MVKKWSKQGPETRFVIGHIQVTARTVENSSDADNSNPDQIGIRAASSTMGTSVTLTYLNAIAC